MLNREQESVLTRNIANTYYERGKFYYYDEYSIKHVVGVCDKAIADLKNAIEMNSTHIEVRYLLVAIYSKEKQESDTARRYLDEIAEIQKGEHTRESLRKFAREFENLGDMEKAAEYFTKAGRME